MNYKSTTKTDGSLYTKGELCKCFLQLFSLQGKKKQSGIKQDIPLMNLAMVTFNTQKGLNLLPVESFKKEAFWAACWCKHN